MQSFLSFFTIPHLVALVAVLVTLVVAELILGWYKLKVSREYKEKKKAITEIEEAERESVRYFSKLHSISIVRISYIGVLALILIALYDIRAFSFVAVAFGAILIALRDVIVSLLSFPHILIHYDIGDDIKIGGVLGEIVRFKTFSVHLAGKDDNGDYNGKLHIVPNIKFVTEIVEQQEIKNSTYRRVTLKALYNKEEYVDEFSVWLPKLKETLSDILHTRSMNEVGNYKTYAGLAYKLSYDFDEDGLIIVTISFIARGKVTSEKKEDIVSYIESTKKKEEKKARSPKAKTSV